MLVVMLNGDINSFGMAPIVKYQAEGIKWLMQHKTTVQCN